MKFPSDEKERHEMRKGTYDDHRKTLGFGGLIPYRLRNSPNSFWTANRIRPQSGFRPSSWAFSTQSHEGKNIPRNKIEQKVNLKQSVSQQLCALVAPAAVIFSNTHKWSSITFTGFRAEIGLLLTGDDAQSRAEQLAQDLSTTEFDLKDQIVADITLTRNAPVSEGVLLVFEVLVVNDA